VGISRTGRVFFRGRGESRTLPEWNRREEVQCLISACWMMKRAPFEAAGGFDEAFNPVEFEDFDLIYRMREAGGRVYYVPEVEMYHFESVTTQGTAALPNTYLIVRNGLLFKKRWRHLFGKEHGPPDERCRWRSVAARRFADIGELPLYAGEPR
jgi:GT2 family glycosyltransferase